MASQETYEYARFRNYRCNSQRCLPIAWSFKLIHDRSQKHLSLRVDSKSFLKNTRAAFIAGRSLSVVVVIPSSLSSVHGSTRNHLQEHLYVGICFKNNIFCFCCAMRCFDFALISHTHTHAHTHQMQMRSENANGNERVEDLVTANEMSAKLVCHY